MADNESIINLVRNFANEIIARGVHLRKIILFGSFASGRQHEWSDIDVALVADEFSGFGFEDRKFFSRINVKPEYVRIDTITYPPEEFEEGDPFIDVIKKTGVEIKIKL